MGLLWGHAVRAVPPQLTGARQADSGLVAVGASARVELRVHGWCSVKGSGRHTARADRVGLAVKVRLPRWNRAVEGVLARPSSRPHSSNAPSQTAYKGAISNALRDALSQLCVVVVDPPSGACRPRVHVSVLQRGSLGALGLHVGRAPSRSEGISRDPPEPAPSRRRAEGEVSAPPLPG